MILLLNRSAAWSSVTTLAFPFGDRLSGWARCRPDCPSSQGRERAQPL